MEENAIALSELMRTKWWEIVKEEMENTITHLENGILRDSMSIDNMWNFAELNEVKYSKADIMVLMKNYAKRVLNFPKNYIDSKNKPTIEWNKYL